MSLEGSKLYRRALLAGSFGFVTFGWDAGVLGGVMLTPEFQSAIGVSSTSVTYALVANNDRILRMPGVFPWSLLFSSSHHGSAV